MRDEGRRQLIVALTMADAAELEGLRIDVEGLTARLGGVPVCPVVATTGQGVEKLRDALSRITELEPPEPGKTWPELTAAARELAGHAPANTRIAEVERLLIDGPSEAKQEFLSRFDDGAPAALHELRKRLFGNEPPLAFGIAYAVLAVAVFLTIPYALWATMIVSVVGVAGLTAAYAKIEKQEKREEREADQDRRGTSRRRPTARAGCRESAWRRRASATSAISTSVSVTRRSRMRRKSASALTA